LAGRCKKKTEIIAYRSGNAMKTSKKILILKNGCECLYLILDDALMKSGNKNAEEFSM
jgi:hypothetical protein